MFIGLVIYFLSLVFLEGTDASLLEPRKRCVPTTTVRGPCHLCVCTAEGVFHCRAYECKEDQYYIDKVNEDCQPDHMYRENTVFCSCSSEGFWKSENCQQKFHHLLPRTALMHHKLRTNVACTPNSLHLIDCNVCQCQSNGYIEVTSCTNRYCYRGHKADRCVTGDILRLKHELCSCSDINYYIDRLCIRIQTNAVQEINQFDLSRLIDIGRSWRRLADLKSNKCDPTIVYTYDCNKCTCVGGIKLACTTKVCPGVKTTKILRYVKGQVEDFDSLPEIFSDDAPCKPGMVYRYNCNTCSCTDGVLSCTTMVCLADFVLDVKSLRGALSTT